MRRISWLSLVAVSALALTASTSPTGAASPSHRCSATSVHAIIDGRHSCLAHLVACRARFNSAYHRYLFHCASGSLEFWWRGLVRRPLHIPTLPSGGACPATEAEGTLGERGNVDAPAAAAFGPGPAYPGLDSDGGRARLNYVKGGDYGDWDGTKLLWTVPRYYGPYIVRGRQLDGPNQLRFDWGPTWSFKLHVALRLVGPYPRLNPAATYLRAPGCYAYQVDGRGFTYLIVFEARLAR
jgi:hypothetical protein